MPELPEVERVRRGLIPLRGFVVKSLRVYCLENLLDAHSLPLLALKGQQLVDLRRKGKYLLFIWREYQWLTHLGMSGVWRLNASPEKHTHLEIVFETGDRLHYTDPRRFGYWRLYPLGCSMERWDSLGPDALDRAFNASRFYRDTRGARAAIKTWLMDQRHVAGVGNIYASEALFRAGIHPQRSAGSLVQEECRTLVREIKQVMRRSLRHGGTTFSDYRLTNGRSGSFQHFLSVFQKEGLPCPRCGAPIERIVQAQRSSFFCPRCQKRSA